jgi:hyaluronoglucosaminidase
MTTRRGWIRLALAVARIAAAALVVVPRTMAAVRYLFLGPAVTFQAGRGPEGIAVSPDGRTVYIGNDNHTITPVSTATGKPGPSIRTAPWFPPGDESLHPIFMGFAPDSRTLYAVDNGKIAAFPVGA